MARTASTMLPLGTSAPDFSLVDAVSGRTVSRAEFQGQPLLVAFICNHCPYVKHIRSGWAQLARDFQDKGVAVVAIQSNDAEQYPDDNPEAMKAEALDAGYSFPYLFDATQEVAQAYRAACTPDFFLFDSEHKLVYRGQMDGARKFNDVPVNGADLRAALDAVLSGRPVAAEQKPSLGCNIKWKPGNEPEYFQLIG
jgi:peroxiredoxin